MKYLKKFDQHTQYDSYIESEDYLKPNVSYCEEHNNIHHSEKDPTMEYLTFTALEDGTFTLTLVNTLTTEKLSYVEYSVDDRKTWIRTDNVNSQTVAITTPILKEGEKVYWRGIGQTYASGPSNYSKFSSTGRFNVSGNINTLLGGNHPETIDISNFYNAYYTYCHLFSGVIGLIDASCLILPAKKVSYYGYYGMFSGCTNLISAPQLPATELNQYCYQFMFNRCTSLTTTPDLPATKLNHQCYEAMFYECISLTTPPKIYATKLEYECCGRMFYGCTSLTTAPDLLSKETDTRPYYNMFYGCTSLNYVKCNLIHLTTPEITSIPISSWLYNVASTGTFVKHPLATWDVIGSSGIPNGWTTEYDNSVIVNYDPKMSFTPSGYLTFTFSSNSYLGFIKKCSYHTIYISKNGTNWQTLNEDDVIQFNQGEQCYVCGNLTNNASTTDYTNFCINGTFSISGNCNALWNYSDLNDQLKEYCGYKLFANCIGLNNISGFVLPSTTLANNCYQYMFYGCTSLTTAPVLPATTLTNTCYSGMFNGCTSLTTAPVLSATTLTSSCYHDMFSGCTSLTAAPALPATTLANSCYGSMFDGCTSLTTAPELLATTLASYCYFHMFNGCTSLTTAPQLPATTLTNNCYWSMFEGCTSLTTAPALPATTLTSSCYDYMFRYCNALNYIKALFITYSSSYTRYWVQNVSSTGIFVKNINATWTTTGTTGVPSGWTIIYFDPSTEKYYLSDKITECDDHGNHI